MTLANNMNDSFYSKETIDAKLQVIVNKVEDIHGIVTSVDAQVRKTNGRVNTLEKFKLVLITALTLLALMSAPNLLTIVKLIAG